MKKTPKKRKSMTQDDLAAILGTTRQNIAHHEKSGDAPKRDDLAGWETLLASKGRTSSDPKELRHDLAKARLEIAREQAARLKRENQVANGTLLDRGEVERECNAAEAYYFQELARLERECGATLAGLAPLPLKQALSKFLNELRQRSREKFAAVSKPTP